MQVCEKLTDMQRDKPSVVTIGNFDGVHLGHQKIIHQVIQNARSANHNAILVTFWPHPKELIKGSEPSCLTPQPEKFRLIEELGVDAIIILRFNRDLMQMRARPFLEMLHHQS